MCDQALQRPELVARVQTALRGPRSASNGIPRECGFLAIDPSARQVLLKESAVELTPTEFDILETLSARPGMASSRRQLIDSVWGKHWVGDEHLVDVHIANLRRKRGIRQPIPATSPRSAGRYDEPVQLAGSSPELERVTEAFNGMSAKIQTTETRRRTLLTDVAHELRTHIAAIDVTLEALEDGVMTPNPDSLPSCVRNLPA